MGVEVVVQGGSQVASPQQEGLSDATLALLAAGVPEGTRRAYAADRTEWAAYCAERGLSPLPIEPMTLAEYVGTLLTSGSPTARPAPSSSTEGARGRRPLAATSVQRRLSALSTWSVEQGHPPPDLRAAKLVLRGHRRSAPAQPRQAAPVTREVLQTLLAQVDGRADGQDTLRARRDRALLLLGFTLGARRSELVALDIADLHSRPEGLSVQVRRAETSDHASAVLVPYADNPGLCAVRAAQALRDALAERGTQTGALFRRVTRTDALLPHRLTPQSVRLVVADLARRGQVVVPDGFAGYSAHSLRRGLATELRRADRDTLAIARQGGWTDNSTALSRYLADVDGWSAHPLQGVL